jgi:hypothetical protein
MLAHCEPQHAGWRGIDTMKVARETHVQAPVCSADIIAEVLAIIVSGLDCEGTRKLASVNKTFRSRSYVAIAVAEFRESQIQLLGLFQSFQVAALRDGRMRLSGASGKNTASVANGKRAFVATVEDNSSLASISHDVEYISTLDSKAKHAAASQISRGNASKGPRPDLQTIGGSQYCEDTVIECGTLKAHSSNKGVRLPLNLSMKLRRSLSDREQRLLALGEGFQKKVLCTFKGTLVRLTFLRMQLHATRLPACFLPQWASSTARSALRPSARPATSTRALNATKLSAARHASSHSATGAGSSARLTYVASATSSSARTAATRPSPPPPPPPPPPTRTTPAPHLAPCARSTCVSTCAGHASSCRTVRRVSATARRRRAHVIRVVKAVALIVSR